MAFVEEHDRAQTCPESKPIAALFYSTTLRGVNFDGESDLDPSPRRSEVCGQHQLDVFRTSRPNLLLAQHSLLRLRRHRPWTAVSKRREFFSLPRRKLRGVRCVPAKSLPANQRPTVNVTWSQAADSSAGSAAYLLDRTQICVGVHREHVFRMCKTGRFITWWPADGFSADFTSP